MLNAITGTAKKAKKIAGDIASDPKRLASAVASGGTTELGRAVGYEAKDKILKPIGEALEKRDPTKIKKVDLPQGKNVTDMQTQAQSQMAGRQAPNINAAQVGAMPTVEAAQINQDPQAQFRQGQAGLASALQAQMAGQGPSLAQSQLQSATDRNIAQAMALAGSQRGGANPAALRNIQNQAAMANQQAARQSAELMAQEQMAARGQLAGVLQGARGQDIGLATEQAGLSQQANLANQNLQGQQLLSQAELDQQAAIANQTAALKQQGLNDAQINAIIDQQLKQQQIQQQGVLGASQIEAGERNASRQMAAGIVGGLGQAAATGAAAMSDRNVKTNIKSGDKDLKGFLNAIGSSKYSYKNKDHGAGTYISPMAQELEKTKLGKDMVIDTPQGKMVDYARGAGTYLSAASMLSKRMDKLEKALKSKRG